MRIIKLSKKHIPQIISLDEASFGKDYDLPTITKEEILDILVKGFILGMFDGRKLISNIQVKKTAKNAWFICGIATLPKKQGKGIADKLLKKIISIAEKQKIIKISAN